jgi:DNA-binding LacI/PurR family transcriptional regulator
VSASASFPESFVLAPPDSLATSIADGEAMTRVLLGTGRPFSAVICTNDLMAVGCLRALKAAGLEVPGDVSVVGIDDASLASVVTPALTTIGSDYFSIGRSAFELLYGVMKEKRYGYVLHRPCLIVRESTGPAKARAGEERE